MLMTNRIRPYAAPWRLFHQMHADINQELSDWLATASSNSQPPMGVWTKEGSAIVALELPGHDLDHIDVSVQRDVLSIQVKEVADDLPEGARVLRRERTHDGLQRQIQLPFELDPQSVEATYERGLLVVRMSAHESAQPARIEVKAG